MLGKITDIVREASALMKKDSAEVFQKEGYANIVTSADMAVQEYLCSRLEELLPGSGFICEEEDIALHDEQQTQHEYTWIIDPIDGTCNFARGIDHCAISVALKHGKEMEMAVVYIPATNELFTAERGKGAWRNGKEIHVTDRPFEDALFCTALAVYHKEYAQICSDIIVETFCRCNDIRRFGAASVELCYLAMGRCELYFEYILSPWDYAAASLILTEAGGVFSDLKGNALDGTKPSGVLAANNKENLKQILEIVSEKTC